VTFATRLGSLRRAMSESFLLAAAHRRNAAIGLPGYAVVHMAQRPFVFELTPDEEMLPDEPWSDVWINGFSRYGIEFPPPPPQDEWKPGNIFNAYDASGRALLAVLREDVEAVREHFRQPSDLLRWRQNYFTCGHVVGFTLYESVLHLAFATLNLDVLKHLFAVAPLEFMQLMGMTNTEEHMGEGAALPLLYSISITLKNELTAERVPLSAAKQTREARLPEVMTWLCETGLMTPVFADFCFPRPNGAFPPPKRVNQEVDGGRWIIEAVYARQHLPAAALSVLQRWERLSIQQQRLLTLASYADVICLPEALCRLPWAQERLLWIAARDKGSLWHKLSQDSLRLVIRAASGTCWVKHSTAEVVAHLRAKRSA